MVVNTCQREKCTGRRSISSLTVGENQTPAGDYTLMCAHSMILIMTTLAEVERMDLIGPSSPISDPGVPGSRLDGASGKPIPTYHC